MLFTHATASRIKTFKQCEFRYFLEYMVQYPPMRGDNIYTGKGSAVHEALEGWVNFKLGVEKKEHGPPVEENWEETLRQYYEKSKLWELDQRTPDKKGNPRGFPHPVEKTCESCPWATKDDRCEIANKATAAVDGCPRPNFQSDIDLINSTLTRTDYDPLALDEEGNFKKKIIGAEVPFDMELGGVRVRGVIDLLFEHDEDTIEICDYKTGKSMSFAKVQVDPQARIYAAVVRILYPQYKYVDVTMHYLKKNPVTVPFGPEDDKLTLKSLQYNAELISGVENPHRVSPSKWGFPCDWCIGHDNCGKIQDEFRVDGSFRLPTISCAFFTEQEPCYGHLHPVKNQTVTIESVKEIIYACKGHGAVNDEGGEYTPKPDDSDKADRQDGDNSEEVQGNTQ